MTVQYIAMAAFLAVGGVIFFLASARAKKIAANMKSPEQLKTALLHGFSSIRLAGESEPVCVAAYHKGMALMIGSTNQRVVVVKQDGELRPFGFDPEGEQLGSQEKNQQKRGYFRWRHDKAVGYTPLVVNGPCSGEEWLMPLQVPGFAEQSAGLREYSSRFNFAWFY